jgi:hypothetical protein
MKLRYSEKPTVRQAIDTQATLHLPGACAPSNTRSEEKINTVCLQASTRERTRGVGTFAEGKKRVIGLATAAMLSGMSLVLGPAVTANADTPNGPDASEVAAAQRPREIQGFFTIVNYGSGLCLEPAGDGLGEPILQQPCAKDSKERPAQVWGLSRATVTGNTTRYQLFNRRTNMCMDVRDGVNANGTVVQRWSCDLHHRSKRWETVTLIPDLYFKVVSEIGSRCLDVRGGSLQAGAQIQIHGCTPGVTNTAQIFAFQPAP